MAGDRQPEPLWARGLAEEGRPAPEEFFGTPPPAAAPPRAVSASAVVVALIGLVTLTLAAAIVTSRTPHTRRTVASAWGDIPMSCDTQRFEQTDHALELFECRSIPAGRLPPGTYRTPADLWTSDLTRQDAAADFITIAPDGRLVGWAIY